MAEQKEPKQVPRRAYGLLDLLEAEGWGEDLAGFLDETGLDSVVPGICWGCGHVACVEPDQQKGWCEECKRGSIRSALILAGVI